jgi:hypothetical protein
MMSWTVGMAIMNVSKFLSDGVEDVCHLRISIHDNFLPHFLSGHVPRLAISSPKRNVESSILSPDANLNRNIIIV